MHHTEIIGAGRRIDTEGEHAPARQRHSHHAGIFAVQHLHAGALKNGGLGGGVIVETGVAVEVVVGNVEHRRRNRLQRRPGLELKAGQLQHPAPAAAPFRVEALHQHVERSRADVAGHDRIQPRGAKHLAGQRGGGGLAVGAGDGNDAGAIAAPELTQRIGQQIHLADDRDATAFAAWTSDWRGSMPGLMAMRRRHRAPGAERAGDDLDASGASARRRSTPGRCVAGCRPPARAAPARATSGPSPGRIRQGRERG
jgi:hypothetical protein